MPTRTRRARAKRSVQPTYQELLRTSERNAQNRCRQRWAWGYMDMMRPKREAPALRFGTLIHRALERYYGPENQARHHPIPPANFFVKLYDKELEETAREWPNWRDEDDEWHTYRELGEAMLVGYHEHWKANDKEYVVLAVEQRFETKIRVPRKEPPLVPPSPTYYVGTFDRILYHIPSRRLLFGDYKTTKNDPTKNSHLALDEQAGAYWAYGPTWITEEAPPSLIRHINEVAKSLPAQYRKGLLSAISEMRFDGILYDFLQKKLPDDRPVNAQGYALNLDGSVSKRQQGPLFHREPVYRDEGDKANVMRRIYEDAKEIGMMRKGELAIKKSPDVFICIGCPFRELCELHETQAPGWEEFREQMFAMYDPYDVYYIDWDELG